MNKRFLVINTNNFIAAGRGAQRRDPPRRENTPPPTVELIQIEVFQFLNIKDAETFISDALANNPVERWVIFEPISFFETIPSAPIKKTWDIDGNIK